MSRKLSWVFSLLVISAMVLAACGGAQTAPTGADTAATEAPAEAAPPEEATTEEATTEETEATEAPAGEGAATTEAPAEGAAAPGELTLTDVDPESPLGRALAGEFEGTAVSMFGPFTDEDAVKFNGSIAAFEEATGIDVQYEGSKEFETTISVRVDAGDPPDIADFPQPGLLENLAGTGAVSMSAPSLIANISRAITTRVGSTWR